MGSPALNLLGRVVDAVLIAALLVFAVLVVPFALALWPLLRWFDREHVDDH